ncbi:hypothetical protein A8C32_09835 [Flavivirga aquatica]|uniref:Uncharacterized protein n=1 Tax=Flavivirga aquatica TaxID=1849968 RepID=A0A1E5TEK6_9FLAO|nr:DUF5991 domain-containing protein [Flavivirga aquatica]OEK09802.1 hypothetical protein A8C32_09835 [Flavivirga aquatica]
MDKLIIVVICFFLLESCKENKKQENIDFFEYIDFDYAVSNNNKSIIEIPFCKIETTDEVTYRTNVDYSGSVFLLNNENINIEEIAKIKLKELMLEHELYIKIIFKDDFLLNDSDDFVPDQPCLFYKENPTYSIYYSGKGYGDLEFVEKTNKQDKINELVGNKLNMLNSVQTSLVPEKWYGDYILFRDLGKIDDIGIGIGYSVEIKKDSVIFSGQGYQTNFYDLCTVKQNKDTLELFYNKTIDGMDYNKSVEGVLAKLYKEKDNYYIISKVINDGSIENDVPILLDKEK